MQKNLYVFSTLKRTWTTNVLFNLISELNRNKFNSFINAFND